MDSLIIHTWSVTFLAVGQMNLICHSSEGLNKAHVTKSECTLWLMVSLCQLREQQEVYWRKGSKRVYSYADLSLFTWPKWHLNGRGNILQWNIAELACIWLATRVTDQHWSHCLQLLAFPLTLSFFLSLSLSLSLSLLLSHSLTPSLPRTRKVTPTAGFWVICPSSCLSVTRVIAQP